MHKTVDTFNVPIKEEIHFRDVMTCKLLATYSRLCR